MSLRTFIPLFLLMTGISVSQPQERVIREQTGPSPLSIEHYSVTGDSSNMTIIPVRIRYDFFVFTLQEMTAGTSFSAAGEIALEIIDSLGNSIARKIKQIALTTSDNSTASLRTQFYQDLFSFQLPAGRYSIALSLFDKESKRQFSDTKKRIDISLSKTFRSGLIPIQQSAAEGYTLFNLGGDVIFSANYGFVFVSKMKYPAAFFTLTKLQPDEDEKETIKDKERVQIDVREQTTVSASLTVSNIVLASTPMQGFHTHYVTFDGMQLKQGRYELTLTFPDSTRLVTNFSARWPEMPLSLFDLEGATEPIQFITTKDEYSELRRGSRNSRIKKFEEFWRKKDPTPLTAYNEVMHEFYRRVDFAVTAFRSLREMNGAVTDRGKIYLLYGKPSSTERLLSPSGAPREIWQYVSLNKTFTFEDPGKQGNYKLAENK